MEAREGSAAVSYDTIKKRPRARNPWSILFRGHRQNLSKHLCRVFGGTNRTSDCRYRFGATLPSSRKHL